MAIIYNPARRVYSKISPGLTDVRQVTKTHSGKTNTLYTFMGCPIISVTANLGFNGSASSLDITLVEDPELGLMFEPPVDMPTIRAISLPKGGGVNGGVIFQEGLDLNPNNFYPDNVPFYFCGVVTSYTVDRISSGARTINVQLADPSEILRGVYCITSGFSLSRTAGANNERYTGITNVIDVFGYYDRGMESERNEFGMPWAKIRNALEEIKCTIFNLDIEFVFTGTSLRNVPDHYRIDGDITDIVSLCSRVAADGGSDIIYHARKTSNTSMIVEIRDIKRTNGDILTKSEIDTFIDERSSIVTSASVGREMKNAPTSKIIIGGPRNSNYVARPSEVSTSIRSTNIGSWPTETKIRVFGGSYQSYLGPTNITTKNATIRSGAIMPFWGLAPDGQTPMLDPFLQLDHIAFLGANTASFIPLCKITTVRKEVRQVPHTEVFMEGDNESDERPFAEISETMFSNVRRPGWIRGIPLNEEILAASYLHEDLFFMLYTVYYPEIAAKLGMPGFDIDVLQKIEDSRASAVGENAVAISALLKNYLNITKFMSRRLKKPSDTEVAPDDLANIIFEMVKQYADEYFGRKFIVCLPKSEIMQRIFDGEPVPTNIENPEIEYVVDYAGYWENVPSEFESVVYKSNGKALSTQELDDDPNDFSEAKQIRDRFMEQDGRFTAMVVVDWKPTGNLSYFSTGNVQVNMTEVSTESYRPNRIAESTPERYYIGCSVSQFPRRPDLALVELPDVITFDPRDAFDPEYKEATDSEAEVKPNGWLYFRGRIAHALWLTIMKDKTLNTVFNCSSIPTALRTEIVSTWADQVFSNYASSDAFDINNAHKACVCSDFAAIIIPLTSNFVSYGPWFSDTWGSKGMVDIDVDTTLVPWNFTRPDKGSDWDQNLNEAGEEKLDRTLSLVDYLDKATISCAGFPEFGLASPFGYNNNLTGISVSFDSNGISTTYSFATYDRRPGTFRKSDFDDISRLKSAERLSTPTTRNVVADKGTALTAINPFHNIGRRKR